MPEGTKHGFSKRLFFLVALLLLAGLAAIGFCKGVNHNGVVPKKIQNSVNFPIYYPDLKKLPTGYNLDPRSFRLAQAGVVLFTVTYGRGKDIIFSEEEQPSSKNIDKFISDYIPVNMSSELAVGQAKLGAYGPAPNIRTIASLPITKGPWLIITAPSDTNQNELVKILQALTK